MCFAAFSFFFLTFLCCAKLGVLKKEGCGVVDESSGYG